MKFHVFYYFASIPLQSEFEIQLLTCDWSADFVKLRGFIKNMTFTDIYSSKLTTHFDIWIVVVCVFLAFSLFSCVFPISS